MIKARKSLMRARHRSSSYVSFSGSVHESPSPIAIGRFEKNPTL